MLPSAPKVVEPTVRPAGKGLYGHGGIFRLTDGVAVNQGDDSTPVIVRIIVTYRGTVFTETAGRRKRGWP